MPLISVITINYNNAGGLKKTIASVATQSCKDIEYIVIDGGSNDGSVAVLKENEKQISKWQSEPDKGIYDAMNKGINLSSGKYLLFLNSGDVFADDKILEELIPSFKNNDIVYGDMFTLENNGQKKHHVSFSEANVCNLMLSTIWHPSSVTSSETFHKCGLFNTGFKLAGDYEFFIRAILKFGVRTEYINKTIAVFDMGGVSNKEENITLMENEREKAWELNFSEPMIDFFKRSVGLYRSAEYKWGKRITKFIP